MPASLPAPDAAYVIGARRPADRHARLARRARARRRLPSSDLALTVMAVPGTTDDGLIKKLVAPGTSIERVTVDGDRGWWISGAPHEL